MVRLIKGFKLDRTFLTMLSHTSAAVFLLKQGQYNNPNQQSVGATHSDPQETDLKPRGFKRCVQNRNRSEPSTP